MASENCRSPAQEPHLVAWQEQMRYLRNKNVLYIEIMLQIVNVTLEHARL